MRVAFATAVLAALLLSGAARAQLAVVPTYAINDAAQRHVVSAVVEPALDRWQALSPQLLPDDLRACPANDVECLRALARKRGASHLLVVAVAPLGPRDAVVAVQLYATSSDHALFEDTVVQAGDAGGADDGRANTRALAERLVATSGPPPATPAPVAPPTAETSSGELGALGLGGVGAVGVGAVGAGLTALLAAQQFTADHDYASVTATVMIGGAVSGALLLGGVALLTVDAL